MTPVTEDLLLQAEALGDLAAVLERAGLPDEARDAGVLAVARARAQGGAAARLLGRDLERIGKLSANMTLVI